MAVGVVVGLVTVAGVTMGRMLALGVDLFPAMAAAVTLLGVDTTGVGLILAVGGSEVLALGRAHEHYQQILWEHVIKTEQSAAACLFYLHTSG